jgi:hypothetical protein
VPWIAGYAGYAHMAHPDPETVAMLEPRPMVDALRPAGFSSGTGGERFLQF